MTWAEVRDSALEAVLDWLASVWPSPVAHQTAKFRAQPGTPEHARAYALDQFMSKVRFGTTLGADMPPLFGLDVLEIGCGHGGITCYLACLGARSVVGIDVNTSNVAYGRELAETIGRRLDRPLPVEFAQMDASDMTFPPASFDVVIAENVFEHFSDPAAVLRSAERVLRPGGKLLVPIFSSRFSKHGLHVKHGLGLPWANLLFPQRVIIGAIRRRAQRNPRLFELYPGLHGEPQRVRDLRRHRDLNDITYSEFRTLARQAGFEIASFTIHPTRLGSVLRRLLPQIHDTKAAEILSHSAAAVLLKPAESA